MYMLNVEVAFLNAECGVSFEYKRGGGHIREILIGAQFKSQKEKLSYKNLVICLKTALFLL